MAFGMEVGLGPSHIVIDGDPAPLPQKGDRAPQFLAHFYCRQTAGWIKTVLGMEVGLIPGDFVFRWGPSFPSSKGAQSPQFSANVRCGQTTGWTKMALGMEVGLGPGDFVFDRDPGTPRTEVSPTTTQFLAHVYCGQMAGWMKTPLGTEVDLGPGHIVLVWVPALCEMGTAAPHLFGPCLLWPRSPISATAELLLLFIRLHWACSHLTNHYLCLGLIV